MGVILVVGFGAVVAVIAGRMSSRAAPSIGADRPFPTAAVDIPRGARIEAMATGQNRLILDLVLANGERRVLVLDLASGTRLGTIELRSAP